MRNDGAGVIRLAWRCTLLCALVTLTACGTFSGRPGSAPGDSTVSARGDGQSPRKRGGYYLDDGPGDNAPADLDAIPDAQPRWEPLHRGASRPYAVMGRSYTPLTSLGAYRERGIATWYGRRYHGQRTSSGEVYDMYAMTGAHTTLPIPSYARVTNLANGRAVVVRINDRGPFLGERLIDLSYVAAHRLDIVRNGAALVEVETILPQANPPAIEASVAAPSPANALAENTQSPQPGEAPAALPAPGHYLQLAAFSVRANAERYLEALRSQLGELDAVLSIANSDQFFRVHAGPYASRTAALQAAERIGQRLGATPILAAPR
ncbi:MAG: septal ring lytic transglycosylase RlpA family protein [Burkholderiales bacterium]|nr:septal ring lytic transglycosylase RlpA family protein [Burkholderiales bacterium]